MSSNLEILKILVTTLNLQGLFQKMSRCHPSSAAPPQSIHSLLRAEVLVMW